MFDSGVVLEGHVVDLFSSGDVVVLEHRGAALREQSARDGGLFLE